MGRLSNAIERWWVRPHPVQSHREVGQSCKTCEYVSDFSDTEPYDEANAYCGHPFHSSPRSEHQDYGGHWTHTDSWCNLWTAARPTREDTPQ